MYIISLKDGKNGAFSIINELNEKIILFFEERDDAERYVIMLNELGYDNLDIFEYEEEFLIKTCKLVGLKYTKISKHDFVVPPGYCDDSV